MNTIQIDGETINIEISAEREERGFRTCTITASHADGGRADFDVILHQAEFIISRCESADVPAQVSDAVRGICRRASFWYGKTPSLKRVTMGAALLANQVTI